MQFTAEMIAGLLNGVIVGDKNATVSTVSSIDGGKTGSLAYLTNPKYEPYIYTTEASIVLVDSTFEPKGEINTTLIKVENVGQCVLNLLEMYNATRPQKSGISKLASIHEGATIGENCYIGDFTVIESTAKIGNNVKLYPQCYIGDNVTIGDGTKLYPGVKIYEGCVVGKNCIIHAGAVIGADGFGFAPKEDGTFAKIPQLGNVIIEDNVELGANTCVDRAKTDSTIVHSGVKLDNLIQVGHNVEIGSNTVMSAQVGIAGTTKIGSNCFVGGQVGFADHITVGNNCKIGSQSGIDKKVPDGEIRFGSPALPGIQYHRSFAVFRNLPEMATKLREIEKRVNKLEE
ncbi:MAG: UDP-3-O-(3-hydroxymyristoyl)glucosamine N-acyltransferase [Paludibacteraceae bacterium]|jgi:UDP-3-O-[3-hydroxymyristoyl] glucosamine N-acyltransferase|nr:UDP-3-O-(3-hydroxymyristoyl)glucosamine N-acyltransferase [Paludibacteraceae bacterium]